MCHHSLPMATPVHSKHQSGRKRSERSYLPLLQDDPDGQGGADTTDESDSEQAQYSRQRAEVLDTAASVFADADEEFGTLGAVKRRLEDWKRRQPEAYGAAYVSDSAPAIFAPFIRNELLAWDPIFQNTPSEPPLRPPSNSCVQLESNRVYQVVLHCGKC